MSKLFRCFLALCLLSGIAYAEADMGMTAIEESESAWEGRESLDSLNSAISSLEANKKGNLDVLTRLSRAYHWKGQRFAESKEQEMDLYWLGHKTGLEALKLNDGFRKVFDIDPEALPLALSKVGRDYAEALYWSAQNLYDMGRVQDVENRYAPEPVMRNDRLIGYDVTNKLSRYEMAYQFRIRVMIDRLLEIGEDVFFGGPLILAGAYYGATPEVYGGKKSLSEEYFQRGIVLSENHFYHKLIFAREYATAINDERLFLQQLTFILGTPPDSMPGLEPEQVRAQELAGKMLEDAQKFFPAVGAASQQEAEVSNEAMEDAIRNRDGE